MSDIDEFGKEELEAENERMKQEVALNRKAWLDAALDRDRKEAENAQLQQDKAYWQTVWQHRTADLKELEAENARLKRVLEESAWLLGVSGSLPDRIATLLNERAFAREALRAMIANPHGCRFCDSGVLRVPDNPAKGHDEDCPYEMAARVLAQVDTPDYVADLAARLHRVEEALREIADAPWTDGTTRAIARAALAPAPDSGQSGSVEASDGA